MSCYSPVPCSDILQDGTIPSAAVSQGDHPSQKQPSKTKRRSFFNLFHSLNSNCTFTRKPAGPHSQGAQGAVTASNRSA